MAYAATGDFIFSFDGTGGDTFDDPAGLAVNSTGFIIVGDSTDDTVQIFNSTGAFVVALTHPDFPGSGFDNPDFITVNSTNFIIVGDRVSGADIVQIYDSTGSFVRALSGADPIGNLSGVAVNSTGHIFVSDNGSNLISIFDKGGFFIKNFTGKDFGGTNFSTLTDIAIDSNDRLLVVENIGTRLIQIFDGNESFVSSFEGTSGGGTVWAGVSAIAIDTSNRILVGDSSDGTIQIYDSSGAFLSTFDGSQGGGTAFTDLVAIAVDSNNRIIVADAFLDIVQVYEGFSSSAGGGSANSHKTRPTFGLDHNTFQQLIEGGFSFNGVSHDITNNWWTPFAEQKVKIGAINSFTTKVFADKQLRVQEFLFGIPNVGEAHKAELGIEIWYNFDGEIENIQVIQKTNIISIDSVKVENTMSKCLSDDADKRCVTTHLSMRFLEPLQDKIMAIKAIDFKRRSNTTYLNEGFDISGNSLNPMNTMMIAGTEKSEGLVEVTQTAKYSAIWTTQDGREFEMNTSGSFTQINQSFERHMDTGVMKNRLHSEFADYKETQADLASSIMPAYYGTSINYEEPFSDINDIFAYEYPETFDSKLDNPEILKKMIIQAEKAQKIMEYLLDPISHHK